MEKAIRITVLAGCAWLALKVLSGAFHLAVHLLSKAVFIAFIAALAFLLYTFIKTRNA